MFRMGRIVSNAPGRSLVERRLLVELRAVRPTVPARPADGVGAPSPQLPQDQRPAGAGAKTGIAEYFVVQTNGRQGISAVDPARLSELRQLRNSVELGTASPAERALWAAVRAQAGKLRVARFDEVTRTDPRAPGSDGVSSVVAAVNQTGDVKQLDRLDNFRSRLTPEQQKEYDAQVAALRASGRVTFDYRDGATANPALEELALRGIVAANFNNPALLEQVLGDSEAEDGRFQVAIYPEHVPLRDFYADNDGNAAGLATPRNDLAVGAADSFSILASGDNIFVHEFAHLQQRVRRDGAHESGRVPGDFPYPEQFEDAFAAPEFQAFVLDRFFGGTRPSDLPADSLLLGNAESWPTVQNLFHQDPEALKRASPDLYAQLVRYSGFDPIAKTRAPAVQLNGQADPVASGTSLATHFEAIAGGDGRITRDDLERVLRDPHASVELQAAAAWALSSPVWFHALDVGSGRGEVDGKISQADAQGFVVAAGKLPARGSAGAPQTREQADAIVRRYLLIADTAAGKHTRDGKVGTDDLRALVADVGTPPALRAAAQYLLTH